MSAPARHGLLELTRAHRHGELSRERYRELRAVLIDGGKAPSGRAAPIRWRRPLAVAIGVAVVAACGILLMRNPAPAPSPAATVPAGSEPVATNPARALVAAFVARDHWDEPAVKAFLAQWAALSPTVRESARGAVWLRPMTNALHERLMEQQALASAGEEETMTRIKALENMRQALTATP